MKSIEMQFREFIGLSYKFDPEIINNQVGDVYIEELTILRKTKISWDFIMLATGEMISIPYVVIDMFKSLDVYNRGFILRTKASKDIEIFIQFMLAFVHSIEEKKYSTTLDGLKLLQQMGLKGFLNYLESVFDLRLQVDGIMCVSKKELIVYL